MKKNAHNKCRCEFKRSEYTIGPRGGIKAKRWRCSRKAKYLKFKTVDWTGRVDGYVNLCGQHMVLVRAANLENIKEVYGIA